MRRLFRQYLFSEHHKVAAEVANAQYDIEMALQFQQRRLLEVP